MVLLLRRGMMMMETTMMMMGMEGGVLRCLRGVMLDYFWAYRKRRTREEGAHWDYGDGGKEEKMGFGGLFD